MGLWRIYNTESVSVKTVPVQFDYSKPGSTKLMEGLPFNKTLPDSIYGWKRYPKTDQINISHVTPYWQVKTNVKTFDKFEPPDIYAEYRQASGVATVSHVLTTDSLSSWSLSGQINWEANYASTDIRNLSETGEGGSFVEIVDDSARVIFRLFAVLNYNTKIETVYCNNTVLLTGSQGSVENIINKFFPVRFQNSAGQLNINFNGNNYPVTSMGGKVSKPANVRLYFWTRLKNASRKVSIKDFEFSKW